MDISIGVIVHNEENLIRGALESLRTQKTKDMNIREIIAVSSGSTDRTDRIISEYDVKLIRQARRLGKASAINEFLKAAASDVLVMVSGDVIPGPDAVERLCTPLLTRQDIGIVACRPKPKKDSSVMGRIVDIQWRLHHSISLEKPKFGEMIAFRKVFDSIDNTAVDEEYIAMLVKKKGLRGAYVQDAVVKNKGPRNIPDFLRQRRRIYSGHMELTSKQRYDVSTMDNLYVFQKLLKTIRWDEIGTAFFAVIFEATGRTLGFFDFLRNRNHHIWEIAKSAKK